MTTNPPRIQYIPDLTPVIELLEAGGDSFEAADILRSLQENQPSFKGPAQVKLHKFLTDGYSIVGHALTNIKTGRHAWVDKHGLVLWPVTHDEYMTNHSIASKIKEHTDELSNLAALMKDFNK
jgi:hypothetical protein